MPGFSLLDTVTLRSSAALTSSFVAATVYRYIVRGVSISVRGVYTRGADGGFCELRFEWSEDGTNWDLDTTLNTTITASNPYFTQAFGLAQFKGPLPADGSAIRFVCPVIGRPKGYDRLRVSAREGSGLTVGTLALHAMPEVEVV